jgi:hypothetical protein
MNREEVIALAVVDLCTALDRDRGRRLALVRQSKGWRVGYQLPQLLDGGNAGCWMVSDWLGALCDDLAEAFAIAAELRVAILARVSAVAPAGTRPELLIVVEDPAKDWTLTVGRTASGQWRWAVLDPDEVEVAGGGGYESEDDAREEGEAELAVWTRPAAVPLVV